MVLLARRALQERLTNKSREGAGGEGVEVGSIVSVLSGRCFSAFGSGDTGEVVQIDHEALNCHVRFESTAEPVPVALRHLKLAASSATPPLTASETTAAALRSGLTNLLRPAAADAGAGDAQSMRSCRDEEGWQEIAAVELKALARVEAAEARAQEAEQRALSLER